MTSSAGRVRRLVVVLFLLLSALALLGPARSLPARAAEQPQTSAVTVAGSGPFQDLKVTVSKTANLVNEVVEVSWTGGTETQPSTGQFSIDYLQLMQCWGDPAAGPDRTQCAFGGKAAFDQRGGDYAATRQLNYGSQLADPAETLEQDGDKTLFVPFRAVNGKTVEGNANEFFDSSTSNEIPYARTRPDGTGQQLFEVQTAREDSGLGCGTVLPDGKPRGCYLVVVPRGDKEVDGSHRTVGINNQLVSSPLSTTNWRQRIVVPLGFAPVGKVCPLGSAERPTVGSEFVAEAITRWQPVLCANSGPVYGYSQVNDSVARRQLLSPLPGIAFLTSPVAPDRINPQKDNIVYAPAALSAVTIAFNIESQSDPKAPDDVRRREGRQITDMRLNQRLVAKLLTQSYRLGVDGSADYLAANPDDLTRDPEFLELNPEFKDLDFRGIADMLVQVGVSDATKLLWQWVASDDDALNFLGGTPDPWGMKINPFYQGMSAPRDDFPKVDPFCHTYKQPGPAPLCGLDAHPYAADFHDAARAAGRGDSLARAAWDPFAIPPAYKKSPLQLSGQRALIAVTDIGSAKRFGLVSARLENAAGQYVAPSEPSMLAAVDAMQPSDDNVDVLAPNPGTDNPLAYPLTTLAYAVTNPPVLSDEDAADYADLITYAAGPGQEPGTNPGELPEGYVPLPTGLREQALAVADEVRNRVGPAAAPSPTPTPTPTETSPEPSTSSSSGSSSSGDDSPGGIPAAPQPAAPAPSSATPKPSPAPSTVTPTPVVQAVPTPADTLAAARVAVVLVAALGLALAIAGPLLPWVSRKWAAYRTHNS